MISFLPVFLFGEVKLALFLEGASPIYPGQVFTAVYQIRFTKPGKVLKEDFPLLRLPGFKPMGVLESRSYTKDGFYVEELRQKLRAEKSGEFLISESMIATIEGTATVPPVKLEVKPFPEEGKPAGFNGSLGIFLFGEPALVERLFGETYQCKIPIKVFPDSWFTFPPLAYMPGITGFFNVEMSLEPFPLYSGEGELIIRFTPNMPTLKEFPSWSIFWFNVGEKKYNEHTFPAFSFKEREKRVVKEPLVLLKGKGNLLFVKKNYQEEANILNKEIRNLWKEEKTPLRSERMLELYEKIGAYRWVRACEGLKKSSFGEVVFLDPLGIVDFKNEDKPCLHVIHPGEVVMVNKIERDKIKVEIFGKEALLKRETLLPKVYGPPAAD